MCVIRSKSLSVGSLALVVLYFSVVATCDSFIACWLDFLSPIDLFPRHRSLRKPGKRLSRAFSPPVSRPRRCLIEERSSRDSAISKLVAIQNPYFIENNRTAHQRPIIHLILHQL